jgi:Cdc6-like AAA superfamily ATPase
MPGLSRLRNTRKFVEFGDACKAYRYIGLCYGPPGVGKTLSARRYSRADSLAGYDRWNDATMPPIMFDTVLYTAEVVNTPSRVALDLGRAREKLTSIAANRAASPYCARNDQAS